MEARPPPRKRRQQLAELKRAYAALAAREAESAARANQGEAREAALRDALAEVSQFTRLQKAALQDATAASRQAEAARRDAEAAFRRDRVAFRQRLDAAEAEAASLNARRRDDDSERARLDALVHESVEAAEEARRVVLERDEMVREARASQEAADAAAAASSNERSRLHESVDELHEELDKARRAADDGGRKLRLSREAERRLRGVVAELRAHPRDDHELETVEARLAERERELKYAEAELAGLSSVFEAKERDLRAGLEAERRQLEARARDAVDAAEQAQADAVAARNLVGELRGRLRGALEKTAPAAPETEPPPPEPPSACPYGPGFRRSFPAALPAPAGARGEGVRAAGRCTGAWCSAEGRPYSWRFPGKRAADSVHRPGTTAQAPHAGRRRRGGSVGFLVGLSPPPPVVDPRRRRADAQGAPGGRRARASARGPQSARKRRRPTPSPSTAAAYASKPAFSAKKAPPDAKGASSSSASRVRPAMRSAAASASAVFKYKGLP